MKVLNRFMSALGYVPAPAKPLRVTCAISLAPGIDRASLDAAIAKLTQLQRAAIGAEAAMNSAAALADFGASDIAAEPARDELLCDIRALIQEIREERHDAIRTARSWGSASAATAELVADETPGLILTELRKQTEMIEKLTQHGDFSVAMAHGLTANAALNFSGLPG